MAECKSLRESGDAIHAFDVALYAASVDTPDINKQFAQELGLDFPLLSDPDRKAATAYGVDSPGGALRWTFFIGQDGRVLYIDKQVNVVAHGRAVAEKLAELGIPRRKPSRRGAATLLAK